MNHKCPANVGKFKNIRDKSFKEVAPSICPQSKGKVLYRIMNTKKGGKKSARGGAPHPEVARPHSAVMPGKERKTGERKERENKEKIPDTFVSGIWCG